jgi:hypothetical protein
MKLEMDAFRNEACEMVEATTRSRVIPGHYPCHQTALSEP